VPSVAYLGDLLLSAATVTARRLRRGPARPSWSWGFEVVASSLKKRAAAISRLDWQGQRAAWGAMTAPVPLLKEITRETTTVAGMPAEWFSPKAGVSHPSVVLFLHGGSFIYGSIETHREMLARITLATGGRVLAVEYRLAPEHVHPAQSEDALAAHRALRESGIPSSRLVLAGDSAGGNLAATTTLALRDSGDPPAAAVLLSPWVNLAARGASLIDNAPFDYAEASDFEAWSACYLGGSGVRRDDPAVSPLFADLAGLPPTLVVLGGAEMLHDQVTDFVARGKAAGSPVELVEEPDMIHNFLAFAGMFPRCGEVASTIGAFVKAHTA
jgi:epsilon-lactone hydrolase